MSSIATAPSRAAERESLNRQLHYLADPEEPPLTDDTSPEETAAVGKAVPLDEVQRVERLLNQLEARSMALVPYGYGQSREAPTPKSNKALIAGSLVAIWLSTLVFAIAYIRFNQTPQVAERMATTAPLLIPTAPDPQDQKVASSVDHLAKALVSSSERLDQLEAAMERSNRDLQRAANKVTTERAVADRPKPANDAKPELSEADMPAEIADGKLPRNWHRVIDAKPSDEAVPHKSANGNIDYWLVPRGADKSQVKVLPIGTSVEGVVVHSLEDGRDYTITPTGEWRNGSVAPTGN
jgi:hypothetical protein